MMHLYYMERNTGKSISIGQMEHDAGSIFTAGEQSHSTVLFVLFSTGLQVEPSRVRSIFCGRNQSAKATFSPTNVACMSLSTELGWPAEHTPSSHTPHVLHASPDCKPYTELSGMSTTSLVPLYSTSSPPYSSVFDMAWPSSMRLIHTRPQR